MLLIAAINWHSFFFLLFALVTCGFALGVLFSSNIVRMAFYLTIALGTTSGLFILAGAHFVGAMQLMIYVGGTMVLLVFGVMLTAQHRFLEMKTNAGEWILALLVGAAMFMLLVQAAFSVSDWNSPHPTPEQIGVEESKTATPIAAALAGVRVDRLDEEDAKLRQGMSGYLMPFVIISMHLLVVLVGAAYLARPRMAVRDRDEGQTEAGEG